MIRALIAKFMGWNMPEKSNWRQAIEQAGLEKEHDEAVKEQLRASEEEIRHSQEVLRKAEEDSYQEQKEAA